jgi:hypothetical protein
MGKETENKKHRRLSIAELKNFKGFENYSDKQAEETIQTLEKVAILFYQFHKKQKLLEAKVAGEKKLKTKKGGKGESRDAV